MAVLESGEIFGVTGNIGTELHHFRVGCTTCGRPVVTFKGSEGKCCWENEKNKQGRLKRTVNPCTG